MGERRSRKEKMEKVVIKAVRREIIGKHVKALRREGKLPAVIYGHHLDPLPILLDAREAGKTLAGLAPSALVTIEVGGKSYPTLVREKQRNVIIGTLIHVDFLAVSMEEKLRTNVSVSIEGVSPAVHDFNGILVVNTNELEVECLPGDLPEKIVVDVSNLKDIGDTIYVSDLHISDQVKFLDEEDTVIVSVIAQVAEEIEEVEEEVLEEEPEIIERGKREEEEE
jgi:large subunit ribosomal protein L25